MRVIIGPVDDRPWIARVVKQTETHYVVLDEYGRIHAVNKSDCHVIYDENKQWWFFFFIGLLVTLAIFSLYMLLQ